MSRTYSFITMLTWHDSRGSECSADATVTFVATPGFDGDQVDPPCAASVEIVAIVTADGPLDLDFWREDDSLIDECFDCWNDDIEAAAEFRADLRRDARIGAWS